MMKKLQRKGWQSKSTLQTGPQMVHPAVMERAQAMEKWSIRQRKYVDENGTVLWVEVRKMEGKTVAQAEDKALISSAAYMAVRNMTLGCQKTSRMLARDYYEGKLC